MSLLKALFGLKTTQSDVIKVLVPNDFKAQTENKNVQLVDVRTSSEYNSGCIKGAKNIDSFSGNFNTQFNKLNKEKPVYIYCRSGARSRRASKKIEAFGFTEIYDLKGGILNY